MRLTCPNCDAEYEVDDSVIPQNGRDVQCSSCGKTWFQESALQQQETDLPNVVKPEAAPAAQSAPHHEPEPEPETEPQMSKPDEAVLDVLRQEAELETAARHQEAQQTGLETQPDLGLDQGDNSQGATVGQRTARLRGIAPEFEKHTHRSDLLPDIEEINSSLHAESDVETQEANVEKKRGRSGFRLGFGLAITFATLLLLAYVYAPAIIEKVPSSEALMTEYVERIDALRGWLDQLMKTATDKMASDADHS